MARVAVSLTLVVPEVLQMDVRVVTVDGVRLSQGILYTPSGSDRRPNTHVAINILK